MRLNKLQTTFIAILGMAFVLSLAIAWKTYRDMHRELYAVTDANRTLRDTVGELTIAITAREKEIDRLSRSSCEARGTGPTGASQFDRSQTKRSLH
jgi:hypothetical protein